MAQSLATSVVKAIHGPPWFALPILWRQLSHRRAVGAPLPSGGQ